MKTIGNPRDRNVLLKLEHKSMGNEVLVTENGDAYDVYRAIEDYVYHLLSKDELIREMTTRGVPMSLSIEFSQCLAKLGRGGK